MTPAQRKAHARMLRKLPITSHIDVKETHYPPKSRPILIGATPYKSLRKAHLALRISKRQLLEMIDAGTAKYL